MDQIRYIKTGDYYIPDWKLSEEHRPIGRWGRMHRDYLKEYHPAIFNQLVLSGNLWTYLADINEQTQQRMEVLVKLRIVDKGVTEELKEANQLEWVQQINNIRCRTEEVMLTEIVYE